MQNTIEQSELIMEVKTAIEDVFIAKIAEEQNGIVLNFLNGQKYLITVQEI